MKDMPVIPLERLREVLSAYDYSLVERIVSTQGKNKGKLRASKPNIPVIGTKQGSYCLVNVHDSDSGKSAYIWRMVAFQVSPMSQHQCMPMTADFDLEIEGYQARRELSKQLDQIVEVVVNHIPKNEWHGIKRWGEAFGMLGTRQYNEDGAAIYRIEE